MGVATRLGCQWKQLAVVLNISYDDIQTIMHDNKENIVQQAFCMLLQWRNANGSEAKKDVLGSVLNGISYRLLAEELDLLPKTGNGMSS